MKQEKITLALLDAIDDDSRLTSMFVDRIVDDPSEGDPLQACSRDPVACPI